MGCWVKVGSALTCPRQQLLPCLAFYDLITDSAIASGSVMSSSQPGQPLGRRPAELQTCLTTDEGDPTLPVRCSFCSSTPA